MLILYTVALQRDRLPFHRDIGDVLPSLCISQRLKYLFDVTASFSQYNGVRGASKGKMRTTHKKKSNNRKKCVSVIMPEQRVD